MRTHSLSDRRPGPSFTRRPAPRLTDGLSALRSGGVVGTLLAEPGALPLSLWAAAAQAPRAVRAH